MTLNGHMNLPSLVLALAALLAAAVLAFLVTDPAPLAAIAAVVLVASAWDVPCSPVDRYLRELCASSAAAFACWLAIQSDWRAEPVIFTAAAILLIAARHAWSTRSGKVTGPPPVSSPS